MVSASAVDVTEADAMGVAAAIRTTAMAEVAMAEAGETTLTGTAAVRAAAVGAVASEGVRMTGRRTGVGTDSSPGRTEASGSRTTGAAEMVADRGTTIGAVGEAAMTVMIATETTDAVTEVVVVVAVDGEVTGQSLSRGRR